MEDLVNKLQGHTEHLLGFFVGLLERYALLEPMLFQEEVAESFNSTNKGRGFTVIQYSLFFACIQDIVKITMDTGKKTPSIANIMKGLKCQSVLRMLREQFTKTKLNIPEDADEAVKESCKRLKNEHDAKRCEFFDNTYNALLNKWEGFNTNEPIQVFKKIRDELIAHLDLGVDNDVYQVTDISKLGLRWEDLGSALSELKPIVLDLNLIIRNASFDIEYAESAFNKMASVFWAKDNNANCC